MRTLGRSTRFSYLKEYAESRDLGPVTVFLKNHFKCMSISLLPLTKALRTDFDREKKIMSGALVFFILLDKTMRKRSIILWGKFALLSAIKCGQSDGFWQTRSSLVVAINTPNLIGQYYHGVYSLSLYNLVSSRYKQVPVVVL